MARAEAPLHRDALALCGVLLGELEQGGGQRSLRERLARGALRLLDAVVLALGDFERCERVIDADAELAMLRTQLRLAFELQVLDEEAFLALIEQCERIGRQIGGWRKRIGAVS